MTTHIIEDKTPDAVDWRMIEVRTNTKNVLVITLPEFWQQELLRRARENEPTSYAKKLLIEALA